MAIKYKWLALRLEELIPSYIKKGINQLPTEQALCDQYMVSRQTVRQALSLLESKGLITKKRGSGSYITGLSSDLSRNVVAVLVSSDTDYIYPGILEDISHSLSDSGFSCKAYVTENRVDNERRILSALLKEPVKGIIAEGCKSALPNPNLDLYRRLMRRGTAVVFLHNYYPDLPNCLYVKDDNLHGSSLLIQHLASQGHTSIGAVFKSDDMQGIERYQGFTEAIQSAGLSIDDSIIRWYDSYDLERLVQAHDTRFLQDMIRHSLNGCTAVVCYNDQIAYYLLQELRLRGFLIPEDLAVVSFDNTYLSRSDIFSLTTLSHHPHEMGTLAAEMMLHKLKGLPAGPQEVSWFLNTRSSTNADL